MFNDTLTSMYTTNICGNLIPNSLHLIAKNSNLFSLASIKLQISLSHKVITDDENRVISVDNGWINIRYSDNIINIILSDISITIIYDSRGLPTECDITTTFCRKTITFEYVDDNNEIIVISNEYKEDKLEVTRKANLIAHRFKHSKYIEYDLTEPFYVNDLLFNKELYVIL